ncbi:hypothetical protein BAUCODRAFT_124961 [Baudoinia panamericana UAMH 10762]|uniref:Uncharacterized protein n=1 Tax=Baudoinia panamericana (strain UAMH 10762) TaxID=717646 RepID=M2MRW9_BAUPA|nr:uncharacterized protein BAUCODRAFT_124961 [Baudoinia panamericana UAMH 10762]EMC94243.1 hypothetical protein BAUCODRAFT_124961 [Baudoinia panamericana UAMH 10762]
MCHTVPTDSPKLPIASRRQLRRLSSRTAAILYRTPQHNPPSLLAGSLVGQRMFDFNHIPKRATVDRTCYLRTAAS